MKVLSLIGTTKTGKTTTIEYIIKELKRRGFSVGSVKEIHYEKFAIDTEGTNTYRHKAAGSEVVTARGYKETDILYPGKLSVEEILKFYAQDYVIMEGVSDYNAPIILCAGDFDDLKEHAGKEYFSRVFAVSGVVTGTNPKGDFQGVPFINAENNIALLADTIVDKVFDVLPDFPPECCDACGYSCRELSARILKGTAKRDDCRLKEAKILLNIDGKPVNMVPFVQSILTDTIKALVGNLKGYKKGRKIEITIND